MNRYISLHTKYIICGPRGFREEFSKGVSHFKSIGAIDPWGVASFKSRGWFGRIYEWSY